MVTTEKQIVQEIVSLLEDKKAQSIVVLDVSHVSMVSDYVVLCNGTSRPHIHALYQTLVEHIKQQGHQLYSVEGQSEDSWILVDVGFCIVHIMNDTLRTYYDLENLWSYENSQAL